MRFLTVRWILAGMLLVAVALTVSIRLNRKYFLSVRIAEQVIEKSGELFFEDDRNFPQERRFDNLRLLIFGESEKIQSNLKPAIPGAIELMWERKYLIAISLKNANVDHNFLELIRAANCVQAISLDSCEITSAIGKGELTCPSVVSLTVQADGHLRPDLLGLCQIFPNLKHMRLDCSNINVQELQNCRNLVRLEILASTIEGLESLRELSSLRVVVLMGYVFESPEKLASLADQLKQLSILMVNVCSMSHETLDELISAHPAIRVGVLYGGSGGTH